MNDINDYGKQLQAHELAQNMHRDFVGGLWNSMGEWQFHFMRDKGGLLPEMRFLDLGCGCFRGGIHFIPYLQPGNYYGLDSNASLLHAGMNIELPLAGLEGKLLWDHVLVNSQFDASSFTVTFERVLAVSLWTHLPLNHIALCLKQISKVMAPGGVFYTTVFLVDDAATFWNEKKQKMGVITYPDQDPYHYSVSMLESLLGQFGLPYTIENLGECGHPRGQTMLAFHSTLETKTNFPGAISPLTPES